MKKRLDQLLVGRGLVQSRSQAENLIRLGKVVVEGKIESKSGRFVEESVQILVRSERYVSRAGLKLESVSDAFALHFDGLTVLDVGSSTGGFTDFALRRGVKKVYAVDVGTDQLHPSLRSDARIELHEKTDIRDFTPDEPADLTVIDVSFISLREVLPHIASIAGRGSQIIAMVKPQFEAGKQQINKGVIKNDAMRRQILKDFEVWSKRYFVIENKADSEVPGAKGNRERFYLLRVLDLV